MVRIQPAQRHQGLIVGQDKYGGRHHELGEEEEEDLVFAAEFQARQGETRQRDRDQLDCQQAEDPDDGIEIKAREGATSQASAKAPRCRLCSQTKGEPFRSSVVGTKAASSVQNSGTIQTKPKTASATMGKISRQVRFLPVIG